MVLTSIRQSWRQWVNHAVTQSSIGIVIRFKPTVVASVFTVQGKTLAESHSTKDAPFIIHLDQVPCDDNLIAVNFSPRAGSNTKARDIRIAYGILWAYTTVRFFALMKCEISVHNSTSLV